MGFKITLSENWNPENGFNNWIDKINEHVVKSKYDNENDT